jgi:hypothetical protein
MDGWLVNYNFFSPHMSLDGKTPAQEVGINCGNHSWTDLVGYEGKSIVQTLEPQPIPSMQ